MQKRLAIVLVAPRIAANVGNIARTTLAVGGELHLVRPFGFFMNYKALKRSSVGYWGEDLTPSIYRDFQHFWEAFPYSENTRFFWATKEGETNYVDIVYPPETVLIFGNEEEGVPPQFWEYKGLNRVISCRIPTIRIRCLNIVVHPTNLSESCGEDFSLRQGVEEDAY